MPKERNSQLNELIDRVLANADRMEIDQKAGNAESFYSTVPGAANNLSDAILANAYDVLILNDNIIEGLNSLDPGTGIYLKRSKKYPDTRSMSIVRKIDSSYAIYLETKSKRYDDTKRKIIWRMGGEKKCKLAFRIDSPSIIPTASLINNERIPKQMSKQNKQEWECTQNMAKKNPDLFCETVTFTETREGKVYKHEYVEGFLSNDLYYTLLPRIEEGPIGVLDQGYTGDQFPKLDRRKVKFFGLSMEKCKWDIFWKIVEGVADLHKEGYVHLDLKPENVMIDYDEQGGELIVKIIDLSGIKKNSKYKVTEFPRTIEYCPPEHNILYDNHDKHKNNTPLGTWVVHLMNQEAKIKLQKSDKATDAHDIWSLGCILCNMAGANYEEMVTKDLKAAIQVENETQKKCKTTNIFSYFFQPDPKKRIDSESLLVMMKKFYNEFKEDRYVSFAKIEHPNKDDADESSIETLTSKAVADLYKTTDSNTITSNIEQIMNYINMQRGILTETDTKDLDAISDALKSSPLKTKVLKGIISRYKKSHRQPSNNSITTPMLTLFKNCLSTNNSPDVSTGTQWPVDSEMWKAKISKALAKDATEFIYIKLDTLFNKKTKSNNKRLLIAVNRLKKVLMVLEDLNNNKPFAERFGK